MLVTLLRVEKKGLGGYNEIWNGDIPLQWRNGKHGDTKTIGTWADADLVSIVKDKFLDLHPTVVPNSLQTRYEKSKDVPVDLILTVQARGIEADSSEVRFKVTWDGDWEDGAAEMQKHARVSIWQ